MPDLPACLLIRNLDRFQHYSQRRPPWVKLHREILDNREFMRLQVASKWLAVCAVLLASENGQGTCLPADAAWWSWRLRHKVLPNHIGDLLNIGFFEPCKQHASNMLADCLQHATSETETETETETEGGLSAASEGLFDPLTGFGDWWNAYAIWLKAAGRRVRDRPKAEGIWRKKKLSPFAVQIRTATNNQHMHWESNKKRECPPPDPWRWLRDQGYNDEVPE